MRDLKAPYGLLSNGKELWLYKREGLNVRLIAKYTAQDLAIDPTPLESFRKQHSSLPISNESKRASRKQSVKGWF